MQRSLFIRLIIVLTLGLTGCRIPPSLPNLVEDNMDIVSAQENAIILLDDLNKYTVDHIWEQFFTQRNATKVWLSLQEKSAKSLFFNLSESKDVYQTDEIVKGIIRYLVCYQVPVTHLVFIGLLKGRDDEDFNFPAEISELTSLQIFELAYNGFISTPINLYKATNLRTLDLSKNRLTQIPPEISNLINLNNLHLYNNALVKIPLEIGILASLKTINFSDNQLKEIPVQIFNLTNLQSLDLSSNQLTTIPIEVSKLSNLQYFDLSYNQLEQIPIGISELINLKTITFSFNKLREIPSSIGNLANLSNVDLSKNKLEALPAELSNLNSLTTLEISSNRLTKLPASLMPTLHRLQSRVFLNGNPWIEVKNDRLIKLDIKFVEALMYRRFPYNLTILCMQCIENQLHVLNQKNLECELPEELQAIRRKKMIEEVCEWDIGKNILYIAKINKRDIPFYLNFSLTTPKSVKNILGSLEQESLYEML